MKRCGHGYVSKRGPQNETNQKRAKDTNPCGDACGLAKPRAEAHGHVIQNVRVHLVT